MRSTSSMSSVQPGTRTKRTQIGLARGGEAAGELVDRLVVHAGEPLVQVGRHGLQAEQHQVDAGQVLVAEPVAEVAVGVERGVDAQLLGRREHLEHEPVLHQRLAAADGQAALHGLQAVAVLLHHLHRARQA